MNSKILFSLLSGFALTPLATGQAGTPYVITTLAGVNPTGDGGPAASALLEFPLSIAVDHSGNVCFGDSGNNRIRIINSTGKINTFVTGYAADLKADSSGALYGTDGVFSIYKVSSSGVIQVIAGSAMGYDGDTGTAAAARFLAPQGIAVDTLGNVYVADTGNYRVRKITTDGRIQTIAGNGTPGHLGDGLQATLAQLNYPQSVEVDTLGNVYIAEVNYIRKVSASGIISTVAGGGYRLVDGNALNTQLGSTLRLARDSSNQIYLADSDANMVRVISSNGNIKTLAGNGVGDFSGDGGQATAATLYGPVAVAVDGIGNLYIADEYNQRIRKIDTAGIISTVAGKSHFAGDGSPAISALMHLPEHAITDGNGNIYISDTDNNRIRKVTPDGKISTLAGVGTCKYAGDHGPAAYASLCDPEALALDAGGNLYVADWWNGVVRRIGTNGLITTIAGTGFYGDTGDNGPATAATFKGPFGLAFDLQGNLYVSDSLAHRVRKVSPSGTITAVAGTGTAGSIGDGGLATAAQLDIPWHVAAGADGSLYISDSANHRVRKIAPSGIITTVAGMQICCGDGGKGTNTYLGRPAGLAIDGSGNLYIAGTDSDMVYKVTPAGLITTIAGNGDYDFTGDGGLAANAALSGPAGLWVDNAGDLYVADQYNSRIRKLTLDSLTSLAILSGDGQSGPVGATLPNALTVAAGFRAGVPIAGTPVTFSVTSGVATLSTGTTTIDATGKAGVAVTLGGTPGPVTVNAAVAGLPAVQFHLTANTVVPLPSISAGGIAGAGSSTPAVTEISPGGFAAIYGSNFAPAGTAIQVQTSDLVGGNLPTDLAGVCVQVNGTVAFLTFVSPGQINIQVPDVPPNTTVKVQVITNCGASNAIQSAPQSVATRAATPEFLYWGRDTNGKTPVIAVNAITGAYVGATGSIAGLTLLPAKPGDILTVYGISFGPTNPAIPPGAPPSAVASTVNAPAVSLGSVTLNASDILYAGASPGTAGLYQLNIRVPAGLPDGDYPLKLSLGTFAAPACGYLTVRN